MGQEKEMAPFEASEIALDVHRCLNLRYSGLDCSYCVKDCPVDAVSLTEDGVDLDADSCIGCGICFQSCPAEVFSSPKWSEFGLLDAFHYESRPPLLFCPQADASAWGGQWFGGVGVCLASLSPGVMAELAFKQRYVVNICDCETCLIGDAEKLIECNVRLANSFLKCWGAPGGLTLNHNQILLEDLVRIGQGNPWNEHRSEKEPVDRSSYLQQIDLLTQRTRLYFGEGRGERKDVTQEIIFPYKLPNKHLPAWRRRLQAFWEKLQRKHGAFQECVWPSLIIEKGKCRACGACMQFCPTGAIDHGFSKGRFDLSFIPGWCLDCGICVASCPHEALNRSSSLIQQPFEQRVVLSKRAVVCVNCGAPVIRTEEGNRLCAWCSSEPELQPLVEDAFVKMFLE